MIMITSLKLVEHITPKSLKGKRNRHSEKELDHRSNYSHPKDKRKKMVTDGKSRRPPLFNGD